MTLPNRLTILRILLIPLFILFCLTDFLLIRTDDDFVRKAIAKSVDHMCLLGVKYAAEDLDAGLFFQSALKLIKDRQFLKRR